MCEKSKEIKLNNKKIQFNSKLILFPLSNLFYIKLDFSYTFGL